MIDREKQIRACAAMMAPAILIPICVGTGMALFAAFLIGVASW